MKIFKISLYTLALFAFILFAVIEETRISEYQDMLNGKNRIIEEYGLVVNIALDNQEIDSLLNNDFVIESYFIDKSNDKSFVLLKPRADIPYNYGKYIDFYGFSIDYNESMKIKNIHLHKP